VAASDEEAPTPEVRSVGTRRAGAVESGSKTAVGAAGELPEAETFGPVAVTAVAEGVVAAGAAVAEGVVAAAIRAAEAGRAASAQARTGAAEPGRASPAAAAP
jgi:hypothetical protein